MLFFQVHILKGILEALRKIIIDRIMSNKDYFSFLSYYSSQVYREDSIDPRYHYPLGTV